MTLKELKQEQARLLSEWNLDMLELNKINKEMFRLREIHRKKQEKLKEQEKDKMLQQKIESKLEKELGE